MTAFFFFDCWLVDGVVITIFRANKNVSGLVKVKVTSPAGLMNIFLNVEP